MAKRAPRTKKSAKKAKSAKTTTLRIVKDTIPVVRLKAKGLRSAVLADSSLPPEVQQTYDAVTGLFTGLCAGGYYFDQKANAFRANCKTGSCGCIQDMILA